MCFGRRGALAIYADTRSGHIDPVARIRGRCFMDWSRPTQIVYVAPSATHDLRERGARDLARIRRIRPNVHTFHHHRCVAAEGSARAHHGLAAVSLPRLSAEPRGLKPRPVEARAKEGAADEVRPRQPRTGEVCPAQVAAIGRARGSLARAWGARGRRALGSTARASWGRASTPRPWRASRPKMIATGSSPRSTWRRCGTSPSSSEGLRGLGRAISIYRVRAEVFARESWVVGRARGGRWVQRRRERR